MSSFFLLKQIKEGKEIKENLYNFLDIYNPKNQNEVNNLYTVNKNDLRAMSKIQEEEKEFKRKESMKPKPVKHEEVKDNMFDDDDIDEKEDKNEEKKEEKKEESKEVKE